MRTLALVLVLGLGSTSIYSASAQSVVPGDLVGAWTRDRGKTSMMPIAMPNGMTIMAQAETIGPYDTLYLYRDSTFRWGAWDTLPEYMRQRERWNYLRGDTLSLWKSGACARGSKDSKCGECATPTPKDSITKKGCLIGEPGFQLTITGRKLTLTPIGATDPWAQGSYMRVDALAPAQPQTP